CRCAQEGEAQSLFLLIRIAREREPKGRLHLLIRIIPGNSENSIGKSSGTVEHPVVVEQIERLERNRRGLAASARFARARTVKIIVHIGKIVAIECEIN